MEPEQDEQALIGVTQNNAILPQTASIHTYLQAATSQNTRRAYQADICHFITWGGLLPATPDGLLRYLQEHASNLNPRTLKRRLVAIKHWHRYQGFSDPTSHPLVPLCAKDDGAMRERYMVILKKVSVLMPTQQDPF